MNSIETVSNILKKKNVNQMSWKKDMWKRVCETWNNEAQNVLEELYNSTPSRIEDLFKAKGRATKYWLYDVGVQVCGCVIGMY